MLLKLRTIAGKAVPGKLLCVRITGLSIKMLVLTAGLQREPRLCRCVCPAAAAVPSDPLTHTDIESSLSPVTWQLWLLQVYIPVGEDRAACNVKQQLML